MGAVAGEVLPAAGATGLKRLRITTATPQDAQAIAQVHVLAWQGAYQTQLAPEFLDALSVDERSAMWSACVAQGEPELLLCRLADQLCGFVAFGASRDADAAPGVAEIHCINFAPAYWAKGMGKKLMEAACERLLAHGFQRATLWVIADNVRALRFYRSLGFEEEAVSCKSFVLGGRTVQEVRYALALGSTVVSN
jgi:ribosomal protein S18 acetylase RimI-like enzyme